MVPHYKNIPNCTILADLGKPLTAGKNQCKGECRTNAKYNSPCRRGKSRMAHMWRIRNAIAIIKPYFVYISVGSIYYPISPKMYEPHPPLTSNSLQPSLVPLCVDNSAP